MRVATFDPGRLLGIPAHSSCVPTTSVSSRSRRKMRKTAHV